MPTPPDLTDPQKEVVREKTGLFVVKACPGSGKTLTVAARLHRLLAEWRSPHAGIATMSFTNTAWQEVEDYLANYYGVPAPLDHPHFLGTIDSFINHFIFLPFGHNVMGCELRPELTGPPYDDHEPIGHWLFWPKDAGECWKYCRINSFSFNENGEIILAGPDRYRHFGKCSRNHRDCAQLKEIFKQRGYATQSDANYFAMKLLEEFPGITKALARRFPVIIVDEAQDSSRIQMRILDALIQAGVSEVMLTGDPYQAIYEWRQAEPQLFEDKFTEWEDNCVWLGENWRSTQSICNLACKLANSSDRITAQNQEVATYDHTPVLYGYDNEAELPELLETFLRHCAEHGINRDDVSILARSGKFINSVITGTVSVSQLVPWRDDDTVTEQISQAKYQFDRGDFREALKRIEIVAYRQSTGRQACRREDIAKQAQLVGLGNWRGQLYRLLNELPKSIGTISSWLIGANAVLSQYSLFRKHTLQIKQDRRPKIYSTLNFDDVFASPTTEPKDSSTAIGTVHSVKGRGLEAVFLALKTRGAKGGNYINLLGLSLLEQEEIRIVYVAVTRAKKALGIAVPRAALDQWQNFLLTSSDS